MRWLGLVRNVMIGREGLHRAVLLDLVERASGTEVVSHLTTGNVTFTAPARSAGALAVAIERGVRDVVGRDELVVLRPLTWLEELVSVDRFGAVDAGWEHEVGLLRHDAPVLSPADLPDPQRTLLVEVRDREVLTARPRTGGRRPHVNRLLETATGQRSTARGWSTLQRIARAEGC